MELSTEVEIVAVAVAAVCGLCILAAVVSCVKQVWGCATCCLPSA